MVSSALVASPPANCPSASTVGGESGSPAVAAGANSVAASSPTSSIADPCGPAERIRAVAACCSSSTTTFWTPECSNIRRSVSVLGTSDQHKRVATSRWLSSASSRLVPTTVSVSLSIGWSSRSTTDWSMTVPPSAPDPTSAKRATRSVTATPKTTSTAVLLRLATPQPAMSQHHHTAIPKAVSNIGIRFAYERSVARFHNRARPPQSNLCDCPFSRGVRSENMVSIEHLHNSIPWGALGACTSSATDP